MNRKQRKSTITMVGISLERTKRRQQIFDIISLFHQRSISAAKFVLRLAFEENFSSRKTIFVGICLASSAATGEESGSRARRHLQTSCGCGEFVWSRSLERSGCLQNVFTGLTTRSVEYSNHQSKFRSFLFLRLRSARFRRPTAVLISLGIHPRMPRHQSLATPFI